MIKKYINSGWLPILGLLFACIAFLFLGNISMIAATTLVLLAFFALAISLVIHLLNKRWLEAIGQIATFIATGAVVVFLGLILANGLLLFEDHDTFAQDLKIPSNIEFNYPHEMDHDSENSSWIRPKEITEQTFTKTHFELYESFQPGLYEYDIWMNSEKPGETYLKVYEITTNTRLSESRLGFQSSVDIVDTNGEIKKFGTKNYFIIYEGDWGEPYGAKFEVWFTDSDSGEETKIVEKNYIIEGWMR